MNENENPITDAEVVDPTPESDIQPTLNESDQVKVPLDQTADTGAISGWKATLGTIWQQHKQSIMFVVGLATALVVWYGYNALIAANNNQTIGEYPNPVALVNGEAIDQVLFEQNVAQILAAVSSQGIDINDETIRSGYEEQAAQSLIDTELLAQAAAAGGYTPDEATVEERLDLMKAQFASEEELTTALNEIGIDREKLRSDIREQISIDTLLRTEVFTTEINVTEAEIDEVYNSLVEAGQEMPPRAEVEAAIKAQIAQQKQQNLITEYIAGLRAEADIQINL